MAIDFEDEYATLRQEMLERFERIHDTGKYGIGAFAAFLVYYYTQEDFNDFVALAVFQLLVLLMGIYARGLYHGIYTIGTYIAYIIEKTDGVRWHRMSRSINDYKYKDRKQNVFKRWGRDSFGFAFLLLVLMVVSGGVVVLKMLPWVVCIHSLCYSQWVLLIVDMSLILVNLYFLRELFWKMDDFRKKEEETWKSYAKDFGKDFPDKYADR